MKTLHVITNFNAKFTKCRTFVYMYFLCATFYMASYGQNLTCLLMGLRLIFINICIIVLLLYICIKKCIITLLLAKNYNYFHPSDTFFNNGNSLFSRRRFSCVSLLFTYMIVQFVVNHLQEKLL